MPKKTLLGQALFYLRANIAHFIYYIVKLLIRQNKLSCNIKQYVS
ncbi:hypothetical protein CV83915_04507 [Escherichia coli]|uniref:Uncharacterized protein n=1 Tax=Escherichia coli TaxID=562 RepID=A0A2H4TYX8_ECOLX|nr:hypothetical protein CV83915_04507 [Escherichia coli]KDU15807.1 hypothetical protein AC58_1296 [Escherichia coli 3-105-05_S3_C3]